MSASPKPCPACAGSLEIPPGYIGELVAAKRSAGLDLADEQVYRQRLATCAGCDSCAEGILCARCGCFVELRALSALRNCPHPAGDRWADVWKGEEE
jgi:hypothetical protein